MPCIFLPTVGDLYKLATDWNPEMEWENRNLVMFRALKLTGNVRVKSGYEYEWDENRKIVKDENGKAITKEIYVNRVTKNPLFRDDDGRFVPVVVNFPKDTVFELSQFKTSYKGAINDVWIKIISSSDKRLINRCASVTVEQFNMAEVEAYGI